MSVNIANKTRAKIKMLEMGIIPAFTGSELKKMMSTLSKEERRAVKRKFRKVWRKIAKNNKDYSFLVEAHRSGSDPDDNTLKTRARMVTSTILRSVK